MTENHVMLGVLRNPRTDTITSRFIREAESMGIQWRTIDLSTGHSEFGLRDENGDFVVTHLTPVATYGEPSGVSLLKEMQSRGVVMLNTPESCAVADNKLLTASTLETHGIPQPQWSAFGYTKINHGVFHEFPVVLKRPEGALGVWNRLARDQAELEKSAKELLAEGGGDLMLQEAITESLGRSIRAVVLDDAVLSATELVAKSGEWRSNGFLGGTGRNRVLKKSERDLAVSACRALGLRYAGVNLLESERGPLVLELNCGSPFDGAERRTGRNIAEMIIKTLLGGE